MTSSPSMEGRGIRPPWLRYPDLRRDGASSPTTNGRSIRLAADGIKKLRSWLPPGRLRDQAVAIEIILLFLLLIYLQKSPDFSIASSLLGIFSSVLLLLFLWKKRLFIPITIAIPFALFTLAVLLTSFTSQVPEESLKDAVFYISLLATFVLGFSLSIRNKDFLQWFTKVFFWFGFFMILGFFVSELVSGRFREGARFIGPFYWHNQMAAFLIYLLPLSLAYTLLQRKTKLLLWITIDLFLLLAFVLTYSRASWLSFVLSLLFFLIAARRLFFRHRKFIIALFLGSLLLGLFLLRIGTVTQRLQSITYELRGETRTVSGNLRTTAYKGALSMFQNYPVFGIGPGAFGEAFRAYQSEPWLYAKYAHNHFFQVAAEMGILGIVTFLTIFIGLAFLIKKYGRETFKKAVKGERRAILLSAFGIALLSSFLHNMLDTDWNWPSLAFLFWFTAGIFIAGLYSQKGKALSLNHPYAKKAFALILLTLFLSSFLLLVVEWNLESGKAIFLNEEYKESSEYFSRVAKIFPLSYTSYLFQGRIEHIGENHDQALNYYKKAVSLNPFTAEPIYGQGIILEKREQKEEAEKRFREASYINPFSDPKYYQKVAEIRLQEDDLGGAEKVLRKAVEVAFPMNESYQGFSYLYTTTGFSERLAETYFRYAIVLSRQEKYEEAAEIVNLALTNLAEDDVGLKILDSFLQTKLAQ